MHLAPSSEGDSEIFKRYACALVTAHAQVYKCRLQPCLLFAACGWGKNPAPPVWYTPDESRQQRKID
jgi:hypothetical protein